jgi:hypothetical protein
MDFINEVDTEANGPGYYYYKVINKLGSVLNMFATYLQGAMNLWKNFYLWYLFWWQPIRIKIAFPFWNLSQCSKIGNLWNRSFLKLCRESTNIQYNVCTYHFVLKGSLTTPGCQEVVSWIVLENTISISEYQLEAFR